MSIFDKLKPQPRWKHADPSIRLEALRDLEGPVELAILAETDPDAKVRRAAVAKISDPAVLGRVGSSDSDPDARDRAADRLLAIATAQAVFGQVRLTLHAPRGGGTAGIPGAERPAQRPGRGAARNRRDRAKSSATFLID
jgi:hypothetical protein